MNLFLLQENCRNADRGPPGAGVSTAEGAEGPPCGCASSSEPRPPVNPTQPQLGLSSFTWGALRKGVLPLLPTVRLSFSWLHISRSRGPTQRSRCFINVMSARVKHGGKLSISEVSAPTRTYTTRPAFQSHVSMGRRPTSLAVFLCRCPGGWAGVEGKGAQGRPKGMAVAPTPTTPLLVTGGGEGRTSLQTKPLPCCGKFSRLSGEGQEPPLSLPEQGRDAGGGRPALRLLVSIWSMALIPTSGALSLSYLPHLATSPSGAELLLQTQDPAPVPLRARGPSPPSPPSPKRSRGFRSCGSLPRTTSL